MFCPCFLLSNYRSGEGKEIKTMEYRFYEESAEYLRSQAGVVGDTAVVLGSGFHTLAGQLPDSTRAACTQIPYGDIPHFPVPTNPAHAGKLLFKQAAGREILLLSGRFHFYEGYTPEQVAFSVRVLHLLGVKNLILTNAAGGIGKHLCVGDLVLITDHIKLCAESPAAGTYHSSFGERFFDMTDTYTADLRTLAHDCAKEMNYPLKEGVYAFMAGPQYETPAEIRALKALGADLVGMSTVMEAIAARQCRMNLLGLSCVTNLAAGLGGTELSDAEVVETADRASRTACELLTRIINRLPE